MFIINSQKDSWVQKIYGSNIIYERHRHRYEVEPKYIDELAKAGLHFTASDETRCRMEVMSLIF